MCVLLTDIAFVLGTTPRGDTGEGPNWACKRDCLLGALITLVFLHQIDTPPKFVESGRDGVERISAAQRSRLPLFAAAA